MNIDLLQLNYKDEIKINETIDIPKEIYEITEIVELKNVHCEGTIKYNIEDDFEILMNVSGEMILHDSIDYKEIPYSFNTEIEEILENSNKTLDLCEFLWHYIVLEIPLKYTTCDSLKKLEGDGYQVISEEEYKDNNNPFKDFFKE